MIRQSTEETVSADDGLAADSAVLLFQGAISKCFEPYPQSPQTDGQTDRRTDRQTDRQADRQAGRQAGRQTQHARTHSVEG